jgi:hypothetical protein
MVRCVFLETPAGAACELCDEQRRLQLRWQGLRAPTTSPAMLFMGSCSRTLRTLSERQAQMNPFQKMTMAKPFESESCSDARERPHLDMAVMQASARVLTSTDSVR